MISDASLAELNKKRRNLMSRYLDPKADDEKTKVVSQELLDIPEIAEAIRLTEEAAYTPGELAIYEGYWDQVRREKTLMSDKFSEGKAEGKAEIAINMLKANKPLDEIVLFTGLSQDDIVSLKDKL